MIHQHKGGRKQLTHGEVNSRLADRRLVLVSSYEKSRTRALFQCDKGHAWKAAPANVLNSTGCPVCQRVVAADKRRLTGELIRDRLAERNIVMIGNYATANTKTQFQCKDGHEWKARPNHVMRGSGCPRCGGRKGTIVIDGREFTSMWSAAKTFGQPLPRVYYRIAKGWTPEQALGLSPSPRVATRVSRGWTTNQALELEPTPRAPEITPKPKVKLLGLEFSSISQAARHFRRSTSVIFPKLKNGCTLEQAFGFSNTVETLQTKYPELSKQWHPDKNVGLTAGMIAPHSRRTVWWLCPTGHVWKGVVKTRVLGQECPYCAGQKPRVEKTITDDYPNLVAQWDWEKNHPARPEDFTPGSNKKVWWKCQEGHSWQAIIGARTKTGNSICPGCSNFKLYPNNSLAHLRPDIAKDWHPKKNAPLTPQDVVAGGHKKVWWICKHDHEWQASITRRVLLGVGCSKCTLQTSRVEIAVYSELCALFDDVVWREKIAGYECDIYLRANGIGVEIDGVYWHSRKPEQELRKSRAFESKDIQLFRLREEGLQQLFERDVTFRSTDKKYVIVSKLAESLLKHAVLTVNQRLRLKGYIDGQRLVNEQMYRQLLANLPAPPLDQSLAAKRPDIAKQWAYDLNAPLLPEHFTCGSGKRVWWRCSEGHVWRVPIDTRVAGNGCRVCSGRVATDEKNLAVHFPDLAREWHQQKNGHLRPKDFLPKSEQKIWWLCNKGHEWLSTVGNRTSGSGCPFCSGRRPTSENNLQSRNPDLVKEWDYKKNKGALPSDFSPGSSKSVWWLCSKGHSWLAIICNRSKGVGCPICNRARPTLRRGTIAEMQSIAAAKGGKCLSSEYLGQHVKLRWECEKGHQWESIPGNVRRLGSWCDTCARKRKHYPKSQLKLAFPANDIPVQINEAALIPADPIGDTSYK